MAKRAATLLSYTIHHYLYYNIVTHISIRPTLREEEKQHYANSPGKALTERMGSQGQRHGARARRNPGVCGLSRALQICIANEWSLSQGAFTWVLQGPL